MSTEAIERRCQWEGCEHEATKHLIHLPERGQITEHDDGGATLALSMVHADLCAVHLPLARDRFGGVMIGLDELCTPECPRAPGQAGGTSGAATD